MIIASIRTAILSFFTTSSRDDRVHPGHARRMVKGLTDLGKGSDSVWNILSKGISR